MNFSSTIVSSEDDHNLEQIKLVLDMFEKNTKVLTEPLFTIILILYGVLVSFAVLGNLTVMSTVLLRKEMRTARNVFIFNLALSDFLLATSIPFTVMDALTRIWPLPQSLLACRMVKTFPCTAAFMSSLTIVAVAVDRYRIIVLSHRKQVGPNQAWLLLPFIFFISCLLSHLVFINTKLVSLDDLVIPLAYDKEGVEFGVPDELVHRLKQIVICIEDWSWGPDQIMTKQNRIGYTVFSSVFQYLLPLATITAVYFKIYFFIKTSRLNLPHTRQKKQRRTNSILFAMSIIFFASWLPFSVFCILTEVFEIFDSTDTMMLTFLICHMVGVSSSITNPILYGFLNNNFVKEFRMIFPLVTKWVGRKANT